MKTYKVIAGGVTIDGAEQAIGTTLELESSGGQLRAWVHFKQVEEVKPKAAGKPLTKKEQEAADRAEKEAADKAAADKAAAENGGGN